MFLTLAACPQRMANQPRLEPLEESAFFDNHMAMRPLVPGTVPQRRGSQLLVAESVEFITGARDDRPIATLPPEMNSSDSLGEILERGQSRYAIFCSHCHDLVGNGHGIVPQRGYPPPPSFHSERLRAEPLGYLYQVITQGKGDMPAHRDQIMPHDRWAIAAYVRALQFSQHAPVDDLPPSDIERLEVSLP